MLITATKVSEFPMKYTLSH